MTIEPYCVADAIILFYALCYGKSKTILRKEKILVDFHAFLFAEVLDLGILEPAVEEAHKKPVIHSVEVFHQSFAPTIGDRFFLRSFHGSNNSVKLIK